MATWWTVPCAISCVLTCDIALHVTTRKALWEGGDGFYGEGVMKGFFRRWYVECVTTFYQQRDISFTFSLGTHECFDYFRRVMTILWSCHALRSMTGVRQSSWIH